MSGTLLDFDILEESGWVVPAKTGEGGIGERFRSAAQTTTNNQERTVKTCFTHYPPVAADCMISRVRTYHKMVLHCGEKIFIAQFPGGKQSKK
jgi:hypothetical protein